MNDKLKKDLWDMLILFSEEPSEVEEMDKLEEILNGMVTYTDQGILNINTPKAVKDLKKLFLDLAGEVIGKDEKEDLTSYGRGTRIMWQNKLRLEQRHKLEELLK